MVAPSTGAGNLIVWDLNFSQITSRRARSSMTTGWFTQCGWVGDNKWTKLPRNIAYRKHGSETPSVQGLPAEFIRSGDFVEHEKVENRAYVYALYVHGCRNREIATATRCLVERTDFELLFTRLPHGNCGLFPRFLPSRFSLSYIEHPLGHDFVLIVKIRRSKPEYVSETITSLLLDREWDSSISDYSTQNWCVIFKPRIRSE